MATNRNAAIRFIFIALLIDVIGFGIVIPVKPQLIEELVVNIRHLVRMLHE
jgi:MFS transporter, DHA1 family, tetracycline resistance protein